MEAMEPVKKGFTLIEMLTCLAIVAVVAAITFPAFSAAKRSAQITSEISNLRQLYVATALYRTTYDGDGIYGDPSSMGLPCCTGGPEDPFTLFEKSHKNLVLSPCGTNPSWFPPTPWQTRPLMDLIYRPCDASTYAKYAAKYRSNSLLYYDINCDFPGVPYDNPHFVHRGLAVLVEGQLINKTQKGRFMDNDGWWSQPEGE
jgi:prepilin-type N-terminal cleavage/methylation domain-containing protein